MSTKQQIQAVIDEHASRNDNAGIVWLKCPNCHRQQGDAINDYVQIMDDYGQCDNGCGEMYVTSINYRGVHF